jgi:hypothetical protein
MTSASEYCYDKFHQVKEIASDHPLRTVAIVTTGVVIVVAMGRSRWKLGPIVSGSAIKWMGF